MVSFIYYKDEKEVFLRLWREYIDNNLASYKYIPVYLEYMLFYSPCLYLNESFVAVENNKCVGICFLPIEQINNILSISLAGAYTIAPLAVNDRIEKVIFCEIDNLSEKHDIKLIKFYIDPLIMEYQNKFNNLRKYGYLDTTSSDCLVDLRIDDSILWGNVRKCYRPLINGMLKNKDFEIAYIDENNKNYEIHEKYRELHRKCAGRETRVKETFDKQFEMLCNDNASLFGLKYKGAFIGFNYFFHYQKTVVYASGADDPEYEDKKIAIYHPILWSALKYYKKRGFDFMQFSQPCGYSVISGFDDYLDEKQLNISHFKRGMGGYMVPFFRGIKCLDNKIIIDSIDSFKNKLLTNKNTLIFNVDKT